MLPFLYLFAARRDELHERPQGLLDEALAVAQRAVAINERRLGKNHPDTAASYNNFATVLQEKVRAPRWVLGRARLQQHRSGAMLL